MEAIFGAYSLSTFPVAISENNGHQVALQYKCLICSKRSKPKTSSYTFIKKTFIQKCQPLQAKNNKNNKKNGRGADSPI